MATIKWGFDPTHSELGFKIRHLMISNVSGAFKDFTVKLETEGDDIRTAKVSAVVEIASIDTKNEQRDAHLRASDFLEAEKHPQMHFESTKLEQIDDENFQLHGELELRGVRKPVTLDVLFSGTAKDPYGNIRAGFTVTGKIRRSDFGVSYNAVLETGGVALGEEVKLMAELEFVKEEVAVPA